MQSCTPVQFSSSGVPSLILSGHSLCWASSQSCRWRSLQKAILWIPGFAKGVIAGVNGPGSVTHFGSSGNSFPQTAHESGFSMRTIGDYICWTKKGLRRFAEKAPYFHPARMSRQWLTLPCLSLPKIEISVSAVLFNVSVSEIGRGCRYHVWEVFLEVLVVNLI